LDNLTHSLAGWVLGQAGLKRTTRKGLAALILGANMPDIDVFFGWVPWQPLATHRGFTHGLVGGVLLMPPLLFGLLWLLDRWQVERGTRFKSALEMRPGWLLALCYLGAITHPSLDLLTTYSVQLLSPFSARWFHADGLFIIDPYLWLLLGGSIIWSKLQEQKGRQWRRIPRVAVGCAFAYICLNLLVTQQAKAAVRDLAGDRQPQAIFTSPKPIVFWRRALVWREGDCYRWSNYDPIGAGAGEASECRPSKMRDPEVTAALRADPELREFLRWSVLPLAKIERSRCSVRVVIGDARYQDAQSRSRLMSETLMPTGVPGC
jgi:inner membrane protein